MKAAAEGVKFQFARALSTVFWVGYFPCCSRYRCQCCCPSALRFFVLFFQQPAVLAAGVLLSTVIGVWSGGIMEDAVGEGSV